MQGVHTRYPKSTPCIYVGCHTSCARHVLSSCAKLWRHHGEVSRSDFLPWQLTSHMYWRQESFLLRQGHCEFEVSSHCTVRPGLKAIHSHEGNVMGWRAGSVRYLFGTLQLSPQAGKGVTSTEPLGGESGRCKGPEAGWLAHSGNREAYTAEQRTVGREGFLKPE